jgi:hypothetical protein
MTELTFRKATASGGASNSCVEVADLPDGGKAVRDSKDHGSGPMLRFTPSEWTAFLDGARNGEFD